MPRADQHVWWVNTQEDFVRENYLRPVTVQIFGSPCRIFFLRAKVSASSYYISVSFLMVLILTHIPFLTRITLASRRYKVGICLGRIIIRLLCLPCLSSAEIFLFREGYQRFSPFYLFTNFSTNVFNFLIIFAATA